MLVMNAVKYWLLHFIFYYTPSIIIMYIPPVWKM